MPESLTQRPPSNVASTGSIHDADGFIRDRSNAEVAASQLRTTHQIRARCRQLLERARAGDSPWFSLDDAALDDASLLVADFTRQRHQRRRLPSLSWWRRLEAGGIDRRGWLSPRLAGLTTGEQAHALIDLTFLGVLLGGHAGRDWRYQEAQSGRTFMGCEGLAVATFHAFASGLFSSRADRPLQADAQALRAILPAHLALAFQSTVPHPLPDLPARALLLRRLGELLEDTPEIFGSPSRPGTLFDLFVGPYGFAVPPTADVRAHDILSQLLITLSGLWPPEHELAGVPLGDCWRHPAVHADGPSDGWVPFHQLLQWLTYSLIEPFEGAGVTVRQVDALTGLPGRHNASLLVDTGVLRLKDPAMADARLSPGDEAIVEWRALTLALLDDLAPRIRARLHLDAAHSPMGSILEGGTRAAGQMLANRLRDGRPALCVEGECLGF